MNVKLPDIRLFITYFNIIQLFGSTLLERIRREYSKDSGFTLLELMVAFGIIGIVSVIGFFSFNSYSKRQILDQAASEIKGAIDEAKFQAISRVKPDFCGNNILSGYEVSFCTTDECDYRVRAQCASEDSDNLDAIIYSKKIPKSVTIASGTSCTTIRYNIINGFQGRQCEIVLEAFSMKRTIFVDSRGNASIK